MYSLKNCLTALGDCDHRFAARGLNLAHAARRSRRRPDPVQQSAFAPRNDQLRHAIWAGYLLCGHVIDIPYVDFLLDKGFIMYPALNLGSSGYQDSPRGRKPSFPRN